MLGIRTVASSGINHDVTLILYIPVSVHLHYNMVALTNFRKTRSATNLIVDTNVQLRDNEITLLTSRNFTLDRTKALEKKHQACTREHVTFEMKAGKNFVIEFSTATYELAKQNLFSILVSL